MLLLMVLHDVFAGTPPSESASPDRRQAFLRQLSKTHEDWQVNQADHALRS
jgi:hypothetical protein